MTEEQTAEAPIRDASDLLNQWAVDHRGKLIRAEECASKVTYACPLAGCGGALSVWTKVKTPHLKHHSGSCTSSGETHEHKLAKRVVRERLEAWIRGERAMPVLLWECPKCRTPHELRAPFEGAELFQEEKGIGGRIPDVLISRKGLPSIAVEVLVTHAVTEAKAAELDSMGVPWFEIRASAVLGGELWCYQRGTLPHRACGVCAAAANGRRAVASALEAEAAQARAQTAETMAAKAEALAAAAQEDARRRIGNAADEAFARAKALDAEAARLVRAAEARKKAALDAAVQAEAAAARRKDAARLVTGLLTDQVRLEETKAKVEKTIADLAASRELAVAAFLAAAPQGSPPVWPIPRIRFVELAADADSRAKVIQFPEWGAACPRCAIHKVRRRPHVDEQLFCFGCGVAFEAAR